MKFRDALKMAEEEAEKEAEKGAGKKENAHVDTSRNSEGEIRRAPVKAEIASEHDFFWRREEMKLVRVKNDRAFFRLETNLKAVIIPMERFGAGEVPARVVNISAGGMGIWTECQCCKGDRLLLKVRFTPKEEAWNLFCEIVRIEEKGVSGFVYGCRWIELGERERERLMESIERLQCGLRG